MFVIFENIICAKLFLDYFNDNILDKDIKCRWIDIKQDLYIIIPYLESKFNTTLNKDTLDLNIINNKSKESITTSINKDIFDIFNFFVSQESVNELKNLIKLNNTQKSKINYLRKSSISNEADIGNKDLIKKISDNNINLNNEHYNIIDETSNNHENNYSYYICDFDYSCISSKHNFDFKKRLLGFKSYNIATILDICNSSNKHANSNTTIAIDNTSKNYRFFDVKINDFNDNKLRITCSDRNKYLLAVNLFDELISGLFEQYKQYLLVNNLTPTNYIAIQKEESISYFEQ